MATLRSGIGHESMAAVEADRAYQARADSFRAERQHEPTVLVACRGGWLLFPLYCCCLPFIHCGTCFAQSLCTRKDNIGGKKKKNRCVVA
jgi:hypothetical protein